jgi:hypothetical protein
VQEQVGADDDEEEEEEEEEEARTSVSVGGSCIEYRSRW